VHPAVITQLRCPICRASLSAASGALQCANRHSFDIARQGYVDLTAGRPVHTGDTPEMVAARASLLTAGHFAPLADAIAAEATGSGLAVEVGAGTGYYLSRFIWQGGNIGLAVDISKAALRRAARADERIGAVRADIWHGLPIADGVAEAILDVFAPRSGAEFARVLRPDGRLIVATPALGHLAELVDALGLIAVDPAKRERLAKSLDPWFVQAAERRVRAPLALSRADAHALVGMGPSAWHTDPAAVARALDEMSEPIGATLDVDLTVWQLPRNKV
jgi:23S rRNA (guanine745-N1)-methyltransferase